MTQIQMKKIVERTLETLVLEVSTVAARHDRDSRTNIYCKVCVEQTYTLSGLTWELGWKILAWIFNLYYKAVVDQDNDCFSIEMSLFCGGIYL